MSHPGSAPGSLSPASCGLRKEDAQPWEHVWVGASGRAGPDPLLLQSPASAMRRAGVRRKNSSLQTLYCPGKGVSGSSHTIGVKGCSKLGILPSLAPLGVLLRCGSPQEAGADEQTHFPEKAGREGSLKVTLRFRSQKLKHRQAGISTHQLSKGRGWGTVPSGQMPCLPHCHQ